MEGLPTVLINTVLLEKNRWQSGKIPTFKVSEWLDRFQKDGFDGIELWENHVIKAEEKEISLLAESTLPIAMYNSYVLFEDDFEEERRQVVRMIRRLGVKKVKFNLGKDPSFRHEYVENLTDWCKHLPDDCQLICECHRGTIMENPEAAESVLNECGDDRIKVLVHPFLVDARELQKWFDYLGSSIVHAHISFYKGGRFYRLDEASALVQRNVQVMKKAGFTGSISLEFTAGVGEETEERIQLYDNALQDIAFLKKVWQSQ